MLNRKTLFTRKQPEGCPNRPGGRLVEGGSRPYGRSELKIKKAASCEAAFSILVADRTGLEPATSGVTGRHSNQLNYRSVKASPLMVGGTGIEPVTLAL